jgi:hypothetical protein
MERKIKKNRHKLAKQIVRLIRREMRMNYDDDEDDEGQNEEPGIGCGGLIIAFFITLLVIVYILSFIYGPSIND